MFLTSCAVLQPCIVCWKSDPVCPDGWQHKSHKGVKEAKASRAVPQSEEKYVFMSEPLRILPNPAHQWKFPPSPSRVPKNFRFIFSDRWYLISLHLRLCVINSKKPREVGCIRCAMCSSAQWEIIQSMKSWTWTPCVMVARNLSGMNSPEEIPWLYFCFWKISGPNNCRILSANAILRKMVAGLLNTSTTTAGRRDTCVSINFEYVFGAFCCICPIIF